MEAVWDTLLYDEIEIESPEWHQDVLEEGRRKIDSGKAKFFLNNKKEMGGGKFIIDKR